MSRSAGTLSGGEAQRIRLATQIGSALTGVLYVLDEPSIGLHQRNNDRLIRRLQGMRDLDNTLIVVVHDEDTMLQTDWMIDIGTGAGEYGGSIVGSVTQQSVMANQESLKGQYLSANRFMPIPTHRSKPSKRKIQNVEAGENNL